MIHLDTHIAARLANGDRKLRRLRGLLETEDVRVSPFVVLELQCLVELRRLVPSTNDLLRCLADDFRIRVEHAGVERVVDSAIGLSWTRDPFDRLIVGHAVAAQAELLTFDETIHQHFPRARRA